MGRMSASGGLRRLISGVLPSWVVGFRKAMVLFHLRRVSSGAPIRAAVGEGAEGETLPSACSGGGWPELGSLSAPRTQVAGPASQHWPRGATCSIFPVLLFSRLLVSDSVQPRDLQHARLPYPSPSSEACSNSCPSSQ